VSTVKEFIDLIDNKRNYQQIRRSTAYPLEGDPSMVAATRSIVFYTSVVSSDSTDKTAAAAIRPIAETESIYNSSSRNTGTKS
jgi:hypothetical protein